MTMLDTSTDTFPQEVARLLSNRDATPVSADGRMPAAVLLLLMEKEGRFHIIFNVRTQQVEHHKGEISFPGGMHEASDPDLRTTALRETWEEMGIRQEDVTILGKLDDYGTHSGFVISPFVGVFPYPYEYNPSEIEVAEVLEAPIDHLLAPANHTTVRVEHDGSVYQDRAYKFQDHVIWGATARMLTQFLTLIS